MLFVLFIINLTDNTKLMKKLILLFTVIIFSFNNVNAQCSSNSLFTALGFPGVYPPELAIPGVPMVGISDGIVGSPYSQTLTLVVLEDTIMDIAQRHHLWVVEDAAQGINAEYKGKYLLLSAAV